MSINPYLHRTKSDDIETFNSIWILCHTISQFSRMINAKFIRQSRTVQYFFLAFTWITCISLDEKGCENIDINSIAWRTEGIFPRRLLIVHRSVQRQSAGELNSHLLRSSSSRLLLTRRYGRSRHRYPAITHTHVWRGLDRTHVKLISICDASFLPTSKLQGTHGKW